MKKILLLLALVSVIDVAVADTVIAPEVAAPHGGMTTKPGAGLPAGHPTQLQDIPADAQLVNSGKVLEVLDSDMYTYLKVTTDKEPLWIAAYKTKVSKGAVVKFSNGIAMSKFYSKSLKRTFDLIVFVDSMALESK